MAMRKESFADTVLSDSTSNLPQFLVPEVEILEAAGPPTLPLCHLSDIYLSKSEQDVEIEFNNKVL